MSLDFYLEKRVEVYSGNCTHNVTPMWHKAGCYDALYNSGGLEAKDIIPFLEKAVYEMEEKPSIYEKLNPENGWGSYTIALEYLREVLCACRENPDTTIRISK